MIASLLIANRGEIAVRIIRTARRLGVRTIAVYSDADRGALHVTEADAAVHLGPAPARDSYLRGDLIIAAARRSGAQAVHPGYGFLSENAEFAAACRAAGLLFVGPDDAALRVMGSKSAARQAVARAGVATVPGYDGAAQDDAAFGREAERVGFPLIVKAAAGGGGKGMRVVRAAAELAPALAAARREAQAAFGDDRLLLERFLESPRHIEVQVFGDRQDNIVHLFERDCTLQRRHQKVIEEAPAAGLDAALRERLHREAVAAARAVHYVGAGTVEFLVQDDEAWFIEMNTRLQVEHPVTEAITGFDLVEWQLRVASGEPLPVPQSAIRAQGHAIELRLCAEDVARELLPAIGALDSFEIAAGGKPWLRFDSGFRSGDLVTPHYDSLLAKLIVHAPDREAAIARASESLRALRVHGVPTNRAFLDVLLEQPDWRANRADTNWIGRQHAVLLAAAARYEQEMPSAVRALLAVVLVRGLPIASAGPDTPWARRDSFQAHLPPVALVWVQGLEGAMRVTQLPSDGFEVVAPDGSCSLVSYPRAAPGETLFEVDGQVWRGQLLGVADGCCWVGDCGSFVLRWARAGALGRAADTTQHRLVAPMPGAVLAVHVTPGQRVERGTRLLTLEAMKMEHTLTAQGAAQVAAVHCEAGQRVGDGALLIELSPVAEPETR